MEFKVGDQVRIVGRFEGKPNWTTEMEATLGKIGKVAVLDLDPPRIMVGFRKEGFGVDYWFYRPEVLKLVPPKPPKEVVDPAVGTAVSFLRCGEVHVGIVDSVIGETHYVMGTDGVLYSRAAEYNQPLEVKYEYYRVPKSRYTLPDKPNLERTKEQLARFVKSSRWNFTPHGKGGAVIARACVYGVKMEGASICSLEDNFNWAEGRKLAVLDMKPA